MLYFGAGLSPVHMATKSYSTRSTLSKSRQRRPCRFGRYTLATKSKGRSTFGQQKLPTFDKVDRVEHVQHWRQCRPRHGRQSRTSRRQSTFDKPATNRRQSRQSTMSPVCTGLYRTGFLVRVSWTCGITSHRRPARYRFWSPLYTIK